MLEAFRETEGTEEAVFKHANSFQQEKSIILAKKNPRGWKICTVLLMYASRPTEYLLSYW